MVSRLLVKDDVHPFMEGFVVKRDILSIYYIYAVSDYTLYMYVYSISYFYMKVLILFLYTGSSLATVEK